MNQLRKVIILMSSSYFRVDLIISLYPIMPDISINWATATSLISKSSVWDCVQNKNIAENIGGGGGKNYVSIV